MYAAKFLVQVMSMDGTIAHMSTEAAVAPKKRTTIRKTTANRRTVAAGAKRKAPTPQKTETKRFSYIKLYIVLLLAFIIVTSISVFIGTRDKGIIDVKATISARAALEEAKGNTELSEAIRSAGKSQTVNREIDDALVGAGNRITEQQKRAKNNAAPAVTASSSATSTTATSTDEVQNEENTRETADDDTEASDEPISEESDSESGDEEESADTSATTEEVEEGGESRGL